MLVILVVFIVFLLVLGFLGNLSSDENVGKGIGIRVELEAVDGQAALLGGEVELEVAGVLLVMLLRLVVVLVLEDGWASCTVEVDSLGLCLGFLDGKRLENADLDVRDLGWEKEGAGDGCQASRGDERPHQHDVWCGLLLVCCVFVGVYCCVLMYSQSLVIKCKCAGRMMDGFTMLMEKNDVRARRQVEVGC